MLASELQKGSAELLVLGMLEERSRHGYEIARLIELRSDGEITFHSATLYPTLYGWRNAASSAANGWRRRVSAAAGITRITAAGRAVLREINGRRGIDSSPP